MANLLKNNSTQGIYILEEENGQIANNTPGEIDLDNLTLGTMYVYFDNVQRFEYKSTFNREGDDFIGFKTWQEGTTKVRASTGAGKKGVGMITVESDEITIVENLERFATLNVRTGSTSGAGKIKYLVKQIAASTFRRFPNDSGVLWNSIGIIIRGISATEVASSGTDTQLINIAVEGIDER